ncbi:ABC-type transport system involved in multi-copper enzyme maturation, permease component [Salinarchaeum sp. Harcht-Bsk1]|uniref:ABC transporter permease subunit n=1 Tax=Salinarchaeum sp. Harcht-Bsk1 TaxID=1333523 RepID=UPI0003422A23|nr:ABC transporter permease subunit [Salinarchaeum sp. Harcht-Bsk1]AGN00034.1 ABC-type transport system involved in multi-copper enzyme maturation, permease component [Salinarchaeum sp. Harcht-Bsk1]
MSVGIVAKKDFRDAIQSRALWALVGTFIVLSVITTYGYTEAPELFGTQEEATFGGLVFFTLGFTALFVPIAAIIVGYKSVAGEREIGSIKLLLSQPTTRRDVFLGKVLGRAAVLATGLAIGLVVGLLFGALLIGGLNAWALVAFVALTLLFVAVYSAVMVSISATTGSTTRATTLAIGFFVLFELVWDVVPLMIVYVVEGFQFTTDYPDWAYIVTNVSPSTAYSSGLFALLPGVADSLEASSDAGSETDAFYQTPELGLVMLVLWIVVPLLVGYYQFNRADL